MERGVGSWRESEGVGEFPLREVVHKFFAGSSLTLFFKKNIIAQGAVEMLDPSMRRDMDNKLAFHISLILCVLFPGKKRNKRIFVHCHQ